MSETATSEFGKLRAFFFPIYMHELKKVLPMFLIFFCISFNYTILRDTKDTLIVVNAGAEAIPFLKFWGVLPAAVIFMFAYAKLSNMLSKEALFYTTITPFLVFFALFALVFYPYREYLQPMAFADSLLTTLPEGLHGLVESIRHWPYAIFYILAELWGSAVLSLMFWGFANDISKVTEAKRFYSLLGIGANIALIFSGGLIKHFSTVRGSLPAGVDPWQVTLNYLMLSIVVAGVVIVSTYWWMQRNVLTDPRFYDPTQVKKKKEKPKMGLGESFAFLARSPYIRNIAMLVIAYGISINLVEVTWKSQLKLYFTTENEYSAFMGGFSQWTGVISVIMMFVGGAVIRRFGWGVGAAMTPAVLLATGAGFFAMILFREQLGPYIASIGTTPLAVAVFLGMAQNIASKATKYSLFDPTKEMSYIPLDQESKVKGKAAIDVVGARLGKSGGSLIQQFLIGSLGSVARITPYVAGILLLVVGGWFSAVTSLNRRFGELTNEESDSTQPVSIKGTPETAAT